VIWLWEKVFEKHRTIVLRLPGDLQCTGILLSRRVEGKPKFKYLLPLDDEIAERIKSLAQTYPQERAISETSDTPGVHPGEGRAARTVALQSRLA
jgi:hypothetical protein